MFLVTVTLAFVLSVQYLPYGVDWQRHFRPATQTFLRGHNPYAAQKGLFMPPWSMIPFIPFAFLPVTVGGPSCSIGMASYGQVANEAQQLGGAFLLLPWCCTASRTAMWTDGAAGPPRHAGFFLCHHCLR
jgi:hypothetical protein